MTGQALCFQSETDYGRAPHTTGTAFFHNPGGGGWGQGCTGREGASEAVREASGGGCQGGWGRLLPVESATEAGISRQGDSGWA